MVRASCRGKRTATRQRPCAARRVWRVLLSGPREAYEKRKPAKGDRVMDCAVAFYRLRLEASVGGFPAVPAVPANVLNQCAALEAAVQRRKQSHRARA